MAIVLTKKKVLFDDGPQLSEFAALIDELGAMQPEFERIKKRAKELDEKLKPFKEKLSRLQELIAEYDERAADETFEELGETYKAEVGKKGCQRRVADIRKAKELLGDEVFFKLCSITLQALDDYLNPDERGQVIAVDRGLRGIKITKR